MTTATAPAPPRRVNLSEVPLAPWRNGGGVTCELLAAPAGERWHWRISIAEVARDGPFSPYPGVQRWIALVEGPGFALDFGAQNRRVLRRPAPLHFDGTLAPHCTLLAGPTRDLNLMLRGVPGRMEHAHPNTSWAPRTRQAGVYATGSGVLHVGQARYEFPAESLLWFDNAPATLVLETTPARPAWWLAVDSDTVAAP